MAHHAHRQQFGSIQVPVKDKLTRATALSLPIGGRTEYICSLTRTLLSVYGTDVQVSTPLKSLRIPIQLQFFRLMETCMNVQSATENDEKRDLIRITSAVVGAYVANNSIPASDLAGLIASVHSSLVGLTLPAVQPKTPVETKPAVSPKRSIEFDHLICLEDGKRFKSLKRHLRTDHGMTPEEYRAKWGLPSTYPMVAPGYAAARSEMAKKMGLGHKRSAKSGAAAKQPAKSATTKPKRK